MKILRILVFVILLPWGIGTTNAYASVPHCKDPKHMDVRVTRMATEPYVNATYINPMSCFKNPNYHSWGEVISFRPTHPLSGMHLYPSAVLWLPAQLRADANIAGGKSVTIYHASGGNLIPFVSMTPAIARQLATDIELSMP